METAALYKQQSNKLIFYGILLFLLGLIIGLVIPFFANSRMGLSSHIEGVLNGMFLIILGLIWHKIALSARWLKISFWLAVYGTFANWFALLYAAIVNAGRDLPFAKGQEGTPLQEGIVSFFLITLSLAMVMICITVLIGLNRNFKQESGK